MKKLFKRLRGDRNLHKIDRRVKTLEKKVDDVLQLSKMARKDSTNVRNLGISALEQKVSELTSTVIRLESRLIESGSAQRLISTPQPKADSSQHTANKENWDDIAQQGELKFHQRPGIRSAETWSKSNELFWEKFGYTPDQFAGKRILDIGAGSRLRGLYFRNIFLAILEPLAEEFSQIEWNDLSKADEVHACAAEEKREELVNQFDFIFSVNALDHGFDFDLSLQNIHQYLRDGSSEAFLTFDAHAKTDDLHPLILTPSSVERSLLDAGYSIDRIEIGEPYHRGISSESISVWCRRKS